MYIHPSLQNGGKQPQIKITPRRRPGWLIWEASRRTEPVCPLSCGWSVFVPTHTHTHPSAEWWKTTTDSKQEQQQEQIQKKTATRTEQQTDSMYVCMLVSCCVPMLFFFPTTTTTHMCQCCFFQQQQQQQQQQHTCATTHMCQCCFFLVEQNWTKRSWQTRMVVQSPFRIMVWHRQPEWWCHHPTTIQDNGCRGTPPFWMVVQNHHSEWWCHHHSENWWVHHHSEMEPPLLTVWSNNNMHESLWQNKQNKGVTPPTRMVVPPPFSIMWCPLHACPHMGEKSRRGGTAIGTPFRNKSWW